jgi:hypothetical protein
LRLLFPLPKRKKSADALQGWLISLALEDRLARFGLELPHEKERILKFGRFAGKSVGSFDFLGTEIREDAQGQFCALILSRVGCHDYDESIPNL